MTKRLTMLAIGYGLFDNAEPEMAPWGGARRRDCTNPWSICEHLRSGLSNCSSTIAIHHLIGKECMNWLHPRGQRFASRVRRSRLTAMRPTIRLAALKGSAFGASVGAPEGYGLALHDRSV